MYPMVFLLTAINLIVWAAFFCRYSERRRHAIAADVVKAIEELGPPHNRKFFLLMVRNTDGICSETLQKSEWRIKDIDLDNWGDKQVLKLARSKQ